MPELVVRLLASAALAAAAQYRDWVPGSCDLSGAEDFLQPLGIGPGLPELDMRFGHFMTKEYPVHGAETVFGNGKEDLKQAPRVTWEQTGKYTEAKYLLLMVDADAGRQPRMHWMKVNAKKTSSSGHEIFPYEPPSVKSGRHRFVAVLFQQMKPGELAQFMVKRHAWDLAGFMKANKEALRPVSYNYFVVDSSVKADENAQTLDEDDDEVF